MAENNKRLILVVDDEVATLRSLKRALEDEYEVAVAPGGETALRYLEGHKPDLILLDYLMPEIDGRETLLRLRSEPKTASIPVIFLTAISDADTVKECMQLDAQGYLLKPIGTKTLLGRLERFFASHGK